MYVPLPWERDRRDVTYPNISFSGTRAERWLTSFRRSTEVTRPRRALTSPVTPPRNSPGAGVPPVGDLLRELEHPEPVGDLDSRPPPAGAYFHDDPHGHQALRDLALEHRVRGALLGA